MYFQQADKYALMSCKKHCSKQFETILLACGILHFYVLGGAVLHYVGSYLNGMYLVLHSIHLKTLRRSDAVSGGSTCI